MGASCATLTGVPTPAALYTDENIVDDHRVLRISWEYTDDLSGATIRAQEQIRVVRELDSDIDIDALLTGLLEVMPGKQAAALAAQLCGQQRNALYQRMLEIREQGGS